MIRRSIIPVKLVSNIFISSPYLIYMYPLTFDIFLMTGVNECASNPCQNGGFCEDGDRGYTCSCADGFLGANCQAGMCSKLLLIGNSLFEILYQLVVYIMLSINVYYWCHFVPHLGSPASSPATLGNAQCEYVYRRPHHTFAIAALSIFVQSLLHFLLLFYISAYFPFLMKHTRLLYCNNISKLKVVCFHCILIPQGSTGSSTFLVSTESWYFSHYYPRNFSFKFTILWQL